MLRYTFTALTISTESDFQRRSFRGVFVLHMYFVRRIFHVLRLVMDLTTMGPSHTSQQVFLPQSKCKSNSLVVVPVGDENVLVAGDRLRLDERSLEVMAGFLSVVFFHVILLLCGRQKLVVCPTYV